VSEIHRSDSRAAANGDASAADRDAKIEQLLLAGLDHYFAAQYEQAINIWTRALFLDRTHARARAYIERARSALAERQRQGEELLHKGVDAFERGEGDEARRLLQAAIDGGAPTDEALALLDRLNRPARGGTTVDLPLQTTRVAPREHADDPAPPASSTAARLIAGAAIVIAVVAVGVYVAGTSGLAWRDLVPLLPLAGPPPAAVAPIAQDVSLPLPRRGEMALAKARALAVSGRLHEALAALDRVRLTDPQKEEADRLRADIQRQLLALTPMPAPVPAEPRRP
jgi:tetratricopeptide (TPR) repeat protein